MADTGLILWLQQYAVPGLTAFFTAITSLGSLEFYMLAIPIIYWTINKHFGFRFAVFFALSAYINSGVKHLFATERPPRELRLVTQEGYSFPSGHAQGSTAFWGFLALELKKPWAYWFSAVLVALISISRLYLGVHWPIDIVGGLAIGLVLLFIYGQMAGKTWYSFSLRAIIVGSVLFAAILYLIHPAGDGPMTIGFLLGAVLGYTLESRHVQFREEATAVQNVIKSSLGLAVLFLLRIALKPVLNWLPADLAIIVRYGLMGFWACFGAPFVFMRVGLYRKTTLTPTL